MLIGMLWFDNSTATFQDKCKRAITYYQTKYGTTPNLIFVHPSTAITEIENVTIKTTRSVMPNHFWIGTDTP